MLENRDNKVVLEGVEDEENLVDEIDQEKENLKEGNKLAKVVIYS